MEMFKSYIFQNWILILVLSAFAVMLFVTSFIDKKAGNKLLILIILVFLLSIVVFVEYYIKDDLNLITLRKVLMAIRYSATPFIIAHVIYTLVRKIRPFVFIPAGLLLVLDIVSIPTGIVFSINESGDLVRGVLGYSPFIIAGLYCAFLIYILIIRSNKRAIEIIPVVFLSVAFISGLVFPFVFGSDFSQIFCTTIAVALFVHYVFSILTLAKKDALTGLLNRQAYYAEVSDFSKDITAIISMDMNGLKIMNDTYGHAAGDEALITLAFCFTRACRTKQSVYRMGGDEFAIVCRKTSEEDVKKLIERIQRYVGETKYTVSIGYSYHEPGTIKMDDLLKDSDEKMYSNKAEYYKNKDRRKDK